MTIWTRLAEYAYFETDRLVLRPFRYEDREDFFAILSNSSNLTYIFPGTENPLESDDLLVTTFMKKPLGIWAIEDKKSQQMIGCIRLEKIDERARQAEVGYFLHQSFWGQGLMTEALKNLVYLSFYHLDLQALTLITHLENAASQKVAQNAGFKKVGQYRGSDRYSHKMRDYIRFRLVARDYSLEIEEEYHDYH